MDRERVVALATGIVLGAVLTLVLTRLVRSGTTTKPAVAPATMSPPPPAAGLGSAARTAELATLRARVAELEQLERAAGSASSPTEFKVDENVGMSTDDGWWSRMPKNAAWDDTRKRMVIDRLAKYLDIKVDPSKVECRTRCCRVTVDEETYDAHSDDLMSTVGLAFEPPDGYGTHKRGDDIVITTCWQTTPPNPLMPDRAAERDAMVAKAADALKKCGASLAHPVTLRMQLKIDEGGEITNVSSNKKQLGTPAAACAETALLQAAAFAPAPMFSEVPVYVVLGKP